MSGVRSAEDELDEAYATLFGTYIEPWHGWDSGGKNTEAVSNLKSVRLPDTVEAIDRAAFSGLKHVTVPGFGELRARNVYFTGSVPPKVVDPNHETCAKLPSYCHVYIPKAYEDVYKKWYKKHDYYRSLDGWHTYNPKKGV